MDPPPELQGYITKQQVAHLFPVSERTVQRYISNQVRTQNNEALSNLALVTDDGWHPGTEVTSELIGEVNRAGQKPRWYIRPSFAETLFGEKPDAQPFESPPPNATRPPTGSPVHGPSLEAEEGSPHRSSEPTSGFLMERITTLERQMREERERHDQLVAKLFAQLEVKDNQISAWDDVTQGLTKALATGQLAPDFSRMLNAPANPSSESETDSAVVDVLTPQEEKEKSTEPEPEVQPQSAPTKPPTKPGPTRKRRPAKSRTRKKTPKSKPTKAKRKDPEPKWWETPTFNKLLRRQDDR